MRFPDLLMQVDELAREIKRQGATVRHLESMILKLRDELHGALDVAAKRQQYEASKEAGHGDS